jgi:catechol 2,3-dioxygenase-like lactoylglutathione lyase family enzyme
MELHRGRLFDHVHLRVSDLAASTRFYEAALGALGIELQRMADHAVFADELWIEAGTPISQVHIAFQAPDHETVQRFHDAVLAAGGRDNGAPGERSYHPGYYAAYALDPDGNNVEAVHHGPSERSAPSVVITG